MYGRYPIRLVNLQATYFEIIFAETKFVIGSNQLTVARLEAGISVNTLQVP